MSIFFYWLKRYSFILVVCVLSLTFLGCGGGSGGPSSGPSFLTGRVVADSNVLFASHSAPTTFRETVVSIFAAVSNFMGIPGAEVAFLNGNNAYASLDSFSGVPSAVVFFSNGDETYSTISDSNGDFSLEITDGEYDLFISASSTDRQNYWHRSKIKLPEESSQLDTVFVSKHAGIDSVEVSVNGQITNERSFNVGDVVSITINASDPNDLPLDYVFRRFRHNVLESTLLDWSSTNTITYTFLEEDAVNGFSVLVGVRNNDGVDADGFFGDAQWGSSFDVTGMLAHALIDSVDVFSNGRLTSQRNFIAGDVVTITVNASDQNNLPLDYVFRRFRQGVLESTLLDWSSTNTITYTFMEEDAVSGFSVFVGVRNNDGVDADGFFGDAQMGSPFEVTGTLAPARINRVDVFSNGQLTSQRNFSVGDVVSITINASDPNNLPLDYVFRRFRQNVLESTLLDWSSTNTITYTFLDADTVNGFSIFAGARNNDGVDADGFFGDAQLGLSFNVY